MRLLSIALLTALASLAQAGTDVLIIQGLAGEPRYASQFQSTTDSIELAVASLGNATSNVLRGAEATREAVLAELTSRKTELAANDVFMLYLVGHGSWDEETYKFNIPGPDLSADELAGALADVPATTQLIVNTSSASGAMLTTLAAEHRVVISATRSGAERHATRFGEFFASGLSEPGADLNKDRRISAAEAFAYAERGVADFYASDNQLATEHPRLEGTRSDSILLARLAPGKRVENSQDPAITAARASRDAANSRVEALKLNRDSLDHNSYQQQLRRALLELALAEEALEQAESSAP